MHTGLQVLWPWDNQTWSGTITALHRNGSFGIRQARVCAYAC